MKAIISTRLKKSLLDTQGDAVKKGLVNALGFKGVSSVRIGKLIEITFDKDMLQSDIERTVNAMCKKLLVNVVMEDYELVIDY